jgi:hypothetical protein
MQQHNPGWFNLGFFNTRTGIAKVRVGSMADGL